MITTAFCKETNSFVNIKNYNPVTHKTLLCNSLHPLTPKLGNINCHHFAHQANTACKHKNKTQWHMSYQILFPQTEIYFETKSPEILKNSPKNFHVADILVDGTVIEIQHSPIGRNDILEREATYDKMIWIFNVKNSVTGTEFICQDQKGFCILRLNKKYLFQTEKETYYDCGKYLCQKISLHGKYAFCKITTYQNFAKKFPTTSIKHESFDILIQDPDFDFAFSVPELQLSNNTIYFQTSQNEDYSPFQLQFPNRYVLF